MVESSVMTSEYPQSHRGRCALGEISNVRGSKAQHGPQQDPGNDKTLVVVYEFGARNLPSLFGCQTKVADRISAWPTYR
jgi:hypothetical protein